MSHTNSTQFYNLPQFIGTDVPGWLTDVNQGYAAIDAGMRAAQVKADNADQTAGQAANDVQAISQTVTTQAAQISAAAGAASAAQTTANGADAKADANANSITGLDTRVTALEQGGSGGVVSERVTINPTDTSFAEVPNKVGYVPTRAAVLSTNFNIGLLVPLVVRAKEFISTATNDYGVILQTYNSSGAALQAVNGYTTEVIVFYDKV